MNWDKIWDILKIVGPYLLEFLQVIIKGPHGQVVENLKEKGIIKDK